MSEFTGERVIPGKVSDDLWAEHISRYAFATRLTPGRRVLDVGCGSGYGSAELARYTRQGIVAIDVAKDAVEYAAAHFPEPRFIQGSATALPFHDASFDLITAFEVIEHLQDWPTMLDEARRVMSPQGILLVSTPNKLYYAESRAASGPNPFHHHEFELEEFRDALLKVFPHVLLFLQNRLEAVAFYPFDRYTTPEADIGRISGNASQANFFIGICSLAPIPERQSLLYVPKASNLLREREHHIRLLETELTQCKEWLAQSMADRDKLLAQHADLHAHLDTQNRWAFELQERWNAAQVRIAQLQDEIQQATAGYEQKIRELEQENMEKTKWALDSEKRLVEEIRSYADKLKETARLLDDAESTVTERTEWARSLERQLREHMARIDLVRQSRWVKLGRVVGLGPDVNEGIPGRERG